MPVDTSKVKPDDTIRQTIYDLPFAIQSQQRLVQINASISEHTPAFAILTNGIQVKLGSDHRLGGSIALLHNGTGMIGDE